MFAGSVQFQEFSSNSKIMSKLLEEKKYAPGDLVDIEVTLHPYRSEPIKRVVEYQLPQNI